MLSSPIAIITHFTTNNSTLHPNIHLSNLKERLFLVFKRAAVSPVWISQFSSRCQNSQLVRGGTQINKYSVKFHLESFSDAKLKPREVCFSQLALTEADFFTFTAPQNGGTHTPTLHGDLD